jgi:hypothetical protein
MKEKSKKDVLLQNFLSFNEDFSGRCREAVRESLKTRKKNGSDRSN